MSMYVGRKWSGKAGAENYLSDVLAKLIASVIGSMRWPAKTSIWISCLAKRRAENKRRQNIHSSL